MNRYRLVRTPNGVERHLVNEDGSRPVAVRIHPRYLNGEKVIAGLKVIPDPHKAGAEYMMVDSLDTHEKRD